MTTADVHSTAALGANALRPAGDTVALDADAIRSPLAAHLSDQLELPLDEALLTVDHLIRTEQCGKHDHGLIRVHYLISSNKFGPYGNRAAPRAEHLDSGRIHLDGRGYLGYPMLDRFIRLGCQTAAERGLCVGTTQGVYPSGALLDWAHRAIEQDIGVILTASSPPRMTSPTGNVPVVGTNPICIGLPTSPRPFVADSATSEINHGQLLLARASGQPLPQHAAVDSEGRSTTDPNQVDPTKGLGALLPVGGSHKSFALALAVELLSSLGGGQPGSSNLADCSVFCIFLGGDLTQAARQSASSWLS
ncbi:MAG: Ldh family oxidoreductase, partial [Planctomycetaceae bacterium]